MGPEYAKQCVRCSEARMARDRVHSEVRRYEQQLRLDDLLLLEVRTESHARHRFKAAAQIGRIEVKPLCHLINAERCADDETIVHVRIDCAKQLRAVQQLT